MLQIRSLKWTKLALQQYDFHSMLVYLWAPQNCFIDCIWNMLYKLLSWEDCGWHLGEQRKVIGCWQRHLNVIPLKKICTCPSGYGHEIRNCWCLSLEFIYNSTHVHIFFNIYLLAFILGFQTCLCLSFWLSSIFIFLKLGLKNLFFLGFA